MIQTLAELALQSGVDILATVKGTEIPYVGSISNPSISLLGAFGGGHTAAGVRVTPDSAMQATVVNACVRVYAESIATVPLLVYRRVGRGKERAGETALYERLHDQPNPWQTSFEWRELMERHRCLRGNAYSLIERNGRGDITALYPLDPTKVQIQTGNDRLPYYRVTELNGHPILHQSKVFHLRNMSKDGYTGLGYIEEAIDAVGLTLALQTFGSTLFSNGATHGGYFKYDGSLKPDQLEAARAMLQATWGGMKNANKPGVLDGAWTWEATSMKAEEAQFLESRGYQVEDIARLFRMPPVMIGHSDKAATYASAEQFFLAFVVHSLGPVAARWEGALNRCLRTDREDDLFAEFLLAGLLRGDIKSRYAAYAVARQWGWFSVDDIRELENYDPLKDGTGDIYLQPMNMVEAGTPPPPQPTTNTLAFIDAVAQVMREAAPQIAAAEEQEDAG